MILLSFNHLFQEETNEVNPESLSRSRPDNLGSYTLRANRKSKEWMEIHKPIIEATAPNSNQSTYKDHRRHSLALGMIGKSK